MPATLLNAHSRHLIRRPPPFSHSCFMPAQSLFLRGLSPLSPPLWTSHTYSSRKDLLIVFAPRGKSLRHSQFFPIAQSRCPLPLARSFYLDLHLVHCLLSLALLTGLMQIFKNHPSCASSNRRAFVSCHSRTAFFCPPQLSCALHQSSALQDNSAAQHQHQPWVLTEERSFYCFIDSTTSAQLAQLPQALT